MTPDTTFSSCVLAGVAIDWETVQYTLEDGDIADVSLSTHYDKSRLEPYCKIFVRRQKDAREKKENTEERCEDDADEDGCEMRMLDDEGERMKDDGEEVGDSINIYIIASESSPATSICARGRLHFAS